MCIVYLFNKYIGEIHWWNPKFVLDFNQIFFEIPILGCIFSFFLIFWVAKLLANGKGFKKLEEKLLC